MISIEEIYGEINEEMRQTCGEYHCDAGRIKITERMDSNLSTSPVAVAIIGCGNFARQQHLPNLARMADDAWRWAAGYPPGALIRHDACHLFDLLRS